LLPFGKTVDEMLGSAWGEVQLNSQENALRTCVDQASSETLFGSVRDMFRFVHGGSKSLRVVLWCSHQDLKSTGEGFVLIAQQCAAIFLSETI
jgi:hypothetical protein